MRTGPKLWRGLVVLVVVLAASVGCFQNDLSPTGPVEPLGDISVRGGDRQIALGASDNRSGGYCVYWGSLGSRSCSIDELSKMGTPPWVIDEPFKSDGEVACASWASSVDIAAVRVEVPDEGTITLSPLPRSRELLGAHLYAACWPAGEVIPRDLSGQLPYSGVTVDGQEISGLTTPSESGSSLEGR